MRTALAELGEISVIIIGYGAVCVGFGMMLGRLFGQAIVRRLLRLLRFF